PRFRDLSYGALAFDCIAGDYQNRTADRPQTASNPAPNPLTCSVMTAIRPASDLNIESSFRRFPPASSKFREVTLGHPMTILQVADAGFTTHGRVLMCRDPGDHQDTPQHDEGWDFR